MKKKKSPYRPPNNIYAPGKPTVESTDECRNLCGGWPHCKKWVKASLGVFNRLCEECFKKMREVSNR